MNQDLESHKISEEGADLGVRVNVPFSRSSPASSTSGAFAQPSGAFAQPSGALGPMFEQVANEYRELSDEYEVGEAIGRGGCAVVLEAWRKTDNMHVVIKVIQLSAGFDENETHVAIARFMREAKLIASLHEEHIVQCVDYGCYQGTPCMILEFVGGLSLDKLISGYGAIPLEFATGIIVQLLSALVETHSKKIIHRDIKPGNIMVFDSPPPYVIRVLDFGISSVQDGLQSQTLMTQQGNVRGTPSYMAPELFTGETSASVESDLYAVGLVYYECLTGEIAFNDKSFMRVAYKQVNEQLEVPGSVPPDIAKIILRLCEKKIEDRYHSAQDVIDDINGCIEKALKEEEKCAIEWEKQKKKRKPKKRQLGARVTTNQGLFSGKHKGRNIALAALLAVIVVGGIIYALILSDRELEKALSQQDQEAAKIEAAVEIDTAAKVDEAKEQIEAIKGMAAMKLAANNVSYAWLAALNRCDESIKAEEKAKAEAEAEEKAKAAGSAKVTKSSSQARPAADSKKNNKNSSNHKKTSGRLQDAEVELPF